MAIERWLKPGAVLVVVAAGLAYLLRPAKLELDPDRITTCPNVPAEVTVTWRAPHTGVVKVFVSQIGEAPRLWTQGSSKGQAKTGPWVGDGTTLTITDESGRTLARKTVESVTCPS